MAAPNPQQQFSLRWNNYSTHIVTAFDDLRSNDELTDVTLSCEGQSIKAHKTLLSCCSKYFRETFRDNPCQHPVIILKGVTIADLQAVVQFMYNGQVNVTQERLSSFLQTAELLQIKGLTDMNDKHDGFNSNAIKRKRNEQEVSEPMSMPIQRSRPPTPIQKRKRLSVPTPGTMNESVGIGAFNSVQGANKSANVSNRNGNGMAIAGPSASTSGGSASSSLLNQATQQGDSNSGDEYSGGSMLNYEADGDIPGEEDYIKTEGDDDNGDSMEDMIDDQDQEQSGLGSYMSGGGLQGLLNSGDGTGADSSHDYLAWGGEGFEGGKQEDYPSFGFTSRGFPKLYYGGKTHTRHKHRGEVQYWMCSNRTCGGRVIQRQHTFRLSCPHTCDSSSSTSF